MTESGQEPALYDLLPIPTELHADIGSVLCGKAESRGARLDALIGPDDSGKSALLRTLANVYGRSSAQVQFIDLSIIDWRQILPSPSRSVDALIIDHIDRISESDHFSAAFEIIDRVIPAIFAGRQPALIISFGQDWRDSFRSIYRLNPETLLNKSLPSIPFAVHHIRPYTEAELSKVCMELELDPGDFHDVTLRRAGVLAMASKAVGDPDRLNGARLREVLTMRWIQAGHDAEAREARRAIWKLMGARTVQSDTFVESLPALYSEFQGRFSTVTLRSQIGGPLRWEVDQVQPDSPAWGDVAAAKALEDIIRGHSSVTIRSPLRSTVVDALLDLSESAILMGQVERKLQSIRGANFSSSGYLGPVLGTILIQISEHKDIRFRELYLQGPDHRELRTVNESLAGIVGEALNASMEESVADLFNLLRRFVSTTLSAYRGSYACWSQVRKWARSLPLRAAAEEAVSRLLPNDGSWRYEDILDVSVTGATSRLMHNHAETLEAVLKHSPADPHEYLADIWDGINDGAWDQIDDNSRGFISSLRLPQESGITIDAEQCRMQRAHIGAQDVSRWRLLNCDVFMADFRSCRKLEEADLSGTNWWSAILPPPARYHLSRSCVDPDFLAWCETPPWRNPYYDEAWPRPFG